MGLAAQAKLSYVSSQELSLQELHYHRKENSRLLVELGVFHIEDCSSSTNLNDQITKKVGE